MKTDTTQKQTTWSEATPDKLRAIENLISCHRAGHRPYVEKRQNKDLGLFEYPVKVQNPALEDIANWTMSYGVPNSATVWTEISSIQNETEKDLAANYVAYFFSSRKDKDNYLKKGKLPRKFSNRGVCGPMKKEDYFKMRPDLVKAGWTNNHLWTTFWKPTVPYWVSDDCGEVYCVTFSDEPAMDEKQFEKFLVEFIIGG